MTPRMNNNHPNPTVTEEMIEAGLQALTFSNNDREQVAAIYLAMKSAAPQEMCDYCATATPGTFNSDMCECNTDLTDVERVARALCARDFAKRHPETHMRKGREANWRLFIGEAETAIAAMPQQPVHADEDELGDGSDFGVTGEWWGQTDVERVARALAKDAGEHWFACDRYNKENERWLKAARAAIAAVQQPVHADVERVIRDLAKQLYAHHVIKYDPEAEEYCIRDAIAALLVPSSEVEAGWVNIPEPTADDFAEVGEAVEGAMLSEQSWPEIGEIAWRILSRDREITDWSNATRQDFSRLTLRHNIETILRQWRDAHPNTLLDKIMSAIPRVSNRSGVERLREAAQVFDDAFGEDEPDMGDEAPAIVKIGQRTTLYALTLGDFRRLRTALDTENSEDHMSREG